MRNRVRRSPRRKRRYELLLLIGLGALLVLAALRAWAAEPSAKTGDRPPAVSRTEPSPRESRAAEPEPPKTPSEKTVLDVPFLDQMEKWPTGCESVCAVMALQYAGVSVTVDQFIGEYLPLGTAPYEDEDGRIVGCDPRKAFPGDPRREDGWGCYSPVIRGAMEQLLQEREETSLSVIDLQGRELDALCKNYVNQKEPVLIWATIGMEEPKPDLVFVIEGTGEEFQWIYPLHCLLLVGWDDDGYYFNDPLEGQAVFYPREAAEKSYKALGKQALAVTVG